MQLRTVLIFWIGLSGISAAADRYEAENAIVDVNTVEKVADTGASGGFYVGMKEGNLAFKVDMPGAGFYTLWAAYSQPSDLNGKIQNLVVNGSATGQVSFPFETSYTTIKASAKVRLGKGENSIRIEKSWGWVNIDYIEITPYVEAPFNLAPGLVNPNASLNTRKVYGFLLENFRKKTVSGFMTNTVMQNDGKYTPVGISGQTEAAWIFAASGKIPALIGLDFLHATGLNSNSDWHQGYTKATLALAEEMFNKGGIPAYCWHWMDPSLAGEVFYTESSGNTPYTNFNLNKAFLDSTTNTAFDTLSPEYKSIIRDLDIVAGHLKTLADKGIPILWRPLHEASGKWFWWGYRGPRACKALYKLMYDRFANRHGLNNLIWVWTTDESGDAMDWYPGDAYVDIISRDYYYYPRIANHGSLVASFEKLKDIFGARKLIALSENGSIPDPDSMATDGAGWSYFMPWYGDYTMDGWAHDNTAADWNSILNNKNVITLDQMPGWANYALPIKMALREGKGAGGVFIRYSMGSLDIFLAGRGADAVELFGLNGVRIAKLNRERLLGPGPHRFGLKGLANGFYRVRVKSAEGPATVQSIAVFP